MQEVCNKADKVRGCMSETRLVREFAETKDATEQIRLVARAHVICATDRGKMQRIAYQAEKL